jgi:hypothetical protein
MIKMPLKTRNLRMKRVKQVLEVIALSAKTTEKRIFLNLREDFRK